MTGSAPAVDRPTRVLVAAATLAVAVGVAAAALLGGCAGPRPPAPAPATGPSSSHTLTDRYGAPRIPHPRDLRGHDQAPCELVTAPQLADLGITTAGRARANAVGQPRCQWEDRTSNEALAITAYSDHDLLVDAYRTRLLPVLTPGTVGGLPVLYQQTTQHASNCTVAVGVAEGQSLEVSYDLLGETGARDSCTEAARVVDAAITNLPKPTR